MLKFIFQVLSELKSFQVKPLKSGLWRRDVSGRFQGFYLKVLQLEENQKIGFQKRSVIVTLVNILVSE